MSFLLLAIHINAQHTQPGQPESFRYYKSNLAGIPVKVLPVIDTAKLHLEDIQKHIDNRYSVITPIVLDIKKEGLKTELKGRGYIWQIELNADQCYSLAVNFSKYRLPKGASVFLYDETRLQISGAYTHENNNVYNVLTLSEFQGKHVILEYFEPYHTDFSGDIVIGSVSQSYKQLSGLSSTLIGINCPEGADWQTTKHAVCLITFNDGRDGYLCSGFLVNNTRIDGTPYFQTANHCINDQQEASTVVAYFNYENSTCTSNDASQKQTLSGATLKATSNYSDFTLLELNETPPENYLPYFSGWDASSRSPRSGTGIHHPAGDPKCISISFSPPFVYDNSITWDGDNNQVIDTTQPKTHWEIIFDEGETLGGSSGSPLFNDQQKAIGQLHGGNDSVNFYGMFSLSWNYYKDSAQQLQYWLDPVKSGTDTLNGTFFHIKPAAAFTSSYSTLCYLDTQKIDDASSYAPTSWLWRISPATYEFQDGTDSLSQNISVFFKDTGYYTVFLKASNQYGSDSIYKTIHDGDIRVNFAALASDTICGCNLVNYPLKYSGISTPSVDISNSGKMTYTLSDDEVNLTLDTATRKYGSFQTWIKLSGSEGSCKASDSIYLNISMPINDYIDNAVPLQFGQNPTYTNFCASVESGEPEAPSASSYSFTGWNSSSESLKNTIWFTFVAPAMGATTINTSGFSDRIAVWDASSAAEILESKGVCVGANDGRSATDNTAIIENMKLQSGKIYWLQVDGKNGETGDCSIQLLCNSIELYPNPSNGIFQVILANNSEGTAYVTLYSATGALLLSDQQFVSLNSNQFYLDLSGYPSGLYLLNVKLNGTNLTTKLMLIK